MECLLNLRNLPHASRPLIPTKVPPVLTFNRRFVLWGLYSILTKTCIIYFCFLQILLSIMYMIFSYIAERFVLLCDIPLYEYIYAFYCCCTFRWFSFWGILSKAVMTNLVKFLMQI